MIKQMVTTGLMGLGILVASTASAHQTNEYFHIHLDVDHPRYNDNYNPHHHRPQHRPPSYHRPQHCVTGHRIDQRQSNMEKRIGNGIKKGQLVGWELQKLKKLKQRIYNKEHQFRKSGHCLTRKEVKKLNHLLNNLSQKIKNLKHNQHRRNYGHHNW